MSVAEFFSMAGHAAFVWPCYLLSLLILGGFVLVNKWQHRKLLRQLNELHR